MQPLAYVNSPKPMKINFTKKQYEDLLKLAYLGNWVVNAHIIKGAPDRFEKLKGYIFSFAKDFGYPEYLDDEDPQMTFPSRTFEDESGVRELIDAYDKETFWDELVDRLSDRDVHEQVSKEKWEQMNLEERMVRMVQLEKKWSDEFEQHGLTRLRVINMTLRTEDEANQQ